MIGLKIARKGFTLGFLVTVIVIFSILSTQFVSITIGYKNQQQVLMENTLEMNRINAEKLAITTDNIIRSLQSTLATTTDYLEASDNEPNRQSKLDLIRESNHHFNSLFVANRMGQVLTSSPSGLNLVGETLTSVGATQALSEQKPLISEPYVGLTGRLLLLISHPLFDQNNEYVGFIGGTVYLHEENVLGTMLGQLPHSEKGTYIYVVSAEGKLLYHPQHTRIGDMVTDNEIVHRVIRGQSGEQRIKNTQNTDMLAGYFPSSETGWGIVSQTPSETVLQSSRDTIRNILTYSIPLVLLIVILIYGLISFISKPLNKLAVFAEQLYDGNTASQEMPAPHRWNYEANQLYQTFTVALSNIQNQFNVLSSEAQTDVLTGLHNRRSMERMLSVFELNQTPYCYLILDIDYFKTVNDTYGHHIGDEVLRFLASTIRSAVGADDICCRYGGEEFVVLSPHADLQAGLKLAEKLRQEVERTASPIGKPITISLGVAASAGDDHVVLVKETADKALYQAKNNGRNQVAG